MANTALSELQQQVEAIRREACRRLCRCYGRGARTGIAIGAARRPGYSCAQPWPPSTLLIHIKRSQTFTNTEVDGRW
jgi:hypothetical protein